MPEEQQNQENKFGLGELLENVKEGAAKVTDAVKDKVENVVGEENLKKVTDVLTTDVGELAKDTASSAVDALENLTGKDINQDGTVGGKPKED
ncbi:MAG: hypothetical protein HC919_13545 [Oscillatoriales cyanobacterium SM2_2_1]|nr:hypothetical protein [Oscillatoriales cyanobacterium SM2_2_1]